MNLDRAVTLAVQSAEEGRRALVVMDRAANCREVFAQLRDADNSGDWKFRNVHGQWRAQHKESDGVLYLLPLRSQGGRGMALDEVYLPQEADEKFRIMLAPCVAASPQRKMALYS